MNAHGGLWKVALALGLALCAPSASHAQSRRARRTVSPPAQDSPITLRVTAPAEGYRWTFALENTTPFPVEFVADRHLLWAEVEPPPPPPGARPRRRARARRCVPSWRPGDNEHSPRVQMQARSSYIEGFDLRDVCGLRGADTLPAGSSLRFHYGFTGRANHARAIVMDERPVALTALTAPDTVSLPSAWPPAPPAEPTDNPGFSLSVRGRLAAARPTGLTATVGLRRTSVHPARVFYRPGMVRFELVSPHGVRATCEFGSRVYAPVRDFFVRMNRGRTISRTLSLASLCPTNAFPVAGTYQAVAIFESRLDRSDFGFAAFSGEVRSRPFAIQVFRRERTERYRALATPGGSEEPPATNP